MSAAQPMARVDALRGLPRGARLPRRAEVVLVLVAGSMAGAIAGASATSSPFMIGLASAALALPAAAALFGSVRRLLIALVVIDIPLQFDVNPGYRDDVAALSALSGWTLSLTTVAIVGLYLAWAARLLVGREKRDWRPRLRAAAIPLVFLALLVLSLRVAQDSTLAGFEINMFAQLTLLLVYLASTVRSRGDVSLIVTALLAGLCLESLVALLMFATGADLCLGHHAVTTGTGAVALTSAPDPGRLAGTFGAPNAAGSYFAFMVPLAIAIFMSSVPKGLRRLALAGCVLGLIALGLTLSRGGWIAFVVAMFVVVLGSRGSSRRRLSRRARVTAAVVVVVVLIPLSGLIVGLEPARRRPWRRIGSRAAHRDLPEHDPRPSAVRARGEQLHRRAAALHRPRVLLRLAQRRPQPLPADLDGGGLRRARRLRPVPPDDRAQRMARPPPSGPARVRSGDRAGRSRGGHGRAHELRHLPGATAERSALDRRRCPRGTRDEGGGQGDPAMTDLSVVIITKNQVWNVDRLLGSVLQETEDVPTAEVLLVDSGSEDGTPERAAQHPIGVLRLLPNQPLTAALGRWVGGRETTGDLVLFLDGDMELCPGWLGRALRTLDERPDVAAVAGTVVDVPVRTPGTTGHWPEDVVAAWRREPVPREITNTGGAALHRRSVLAATGSFHPFLRSEEEPELCLRIRDAGHRVLHLDTPIALHYSTPARTVGTLLARRRRRLYEGMGQVIRQHVGTPLGRTYLRERGYGIAPGLGCSPVPVRLRPASARAAGGPSRSGRPPSRARSASMRPAGAAWVTRCSASCSARASSRGRSAGSSASRRRPNPIPRASRLCSASRSESVPPLTVEHREATRPQCHQEIGVVRMDHVTAARPDGATVMTQRFHEMRLDASGHHRPLRRGDHEELPEHGSASAGRHSSCRTLHVPPRSRRHTNQPTTRPRRRTTRRRISAAGDAVLATSPRSQSR